MSTFRNHARTFVTSVVALALVAGVSPGAQAAASAPEESLQARIEAVLAKFPGGTQIGPNEISWDGGQIVLTLQGGTVGAETFAVGSCATDAHCAYSGTYQSGSKLTFWACSTTVSTSAIGQARSVANARSSGYVDAKNSSGSVLATIWAGGSLGSAPAGVTKLTCVP